MTEQTPPDPCATCPYFSLDTGIVARPDRTRRHQKPLHLNEADVHPLAADLFEAFDAGRVIWPRDRTIKAVEAMIRRYAR